MSAAGPTSHPIRNPGSAIALERPFVTIAFSYKSAKLGGSVPSNSAPL
jgi:hypothetical protein